MSATFTLRTTVTKLDLDAQRHVNNTVYLRWAQEVAVAHWRSLAPADAQENIGWVVRRHEIDYKAPALLGDEIILFTRVGEASRLTFERFTEIRRAADSLILCQARTLWVPINSATGRPTRVPAEVRALFSVGETSDPAIAR